jgi:hypothetical protein
MSLSTYGPLPAMREDRRRFAALSHKRILIYWPHGFGDWVHLSYVAPLLEDTNAYAVTRFGDDYVSLMENAAVLEPLLTGLRIPGDGAELGAQHLGLQLRRCSGRMLSLRLPAPLDRAVAAFAPDALLWTDYPETEGRTAYPFHTKARNLARLLVHPERLATFDLSRPLRSAVDFQAAPEIQRRVDERLRSLLPAAGRLCVISRSGVTASRKNWGDGSQTRAFVTAMRRESPAWRFISMEDEELCGAAGFRALFGDLDEPFARIYKALAGRIELFIGIPAGPLHFTLARGGVPTIGLWAAHHPDWYDEPNADAIHLVGSYVRERGFERRAATTSKPESLRHRLWYLDTPQAGELEVLEAVRLLTG